VTPRTVAFVTLGCRVNLADTQELQSVLERRGFRTVAFAEPADIVIVNSCTVTARAELSDRQAIRRASRVSPHARVVVTGCWAETSPAGVAALDGVDLVVGNADKPRLPELLERLVVEGEGDARLTGREAATGVAPPLPRRPPRSRAFVKVQDGCQHRCAFCIVPFARGRSRSVPPASVLERVRALVAAGHPEIVLTGVDLGHYGAGLVPRVSLAALLRELERIPRLRWLRLSSLLPSYVTPELLDVLTRSPVIAPHFHVPLQSGSDRVLRLMRRPYTVAMYRRLVERLAAALPSAGIGTDVIAGFPGETDDDFAATRDLLDALPLSYLHVFPYSTRAGTEAAHRPDQVEARVAARRARTLRELGAVKSLAFRQRLVGRTEDVLVLDTHDRVTGHRLGLTGNYVEVGFDARAHSGARITRVRIIGVDGERTEGRLADFPAATTRSVA
jgi:threonylcarbamoyladenosine tRNA methylthiotransferase MtaB